MMVLFFVFREVPKSKVHAQESSASEKGDGEPASKKAKLDENETTTVKKVDFNTRKCHQIFTAVLIKPTCS